MLYDNIRMSVHNVCVCVCVCVCAGVCVFVLINKSKIHAWLLCISVTGRSGQFFACDSIRMLVLAKSLFCALTLTQK